MQIYKLFLKKDSNKNFIIFEHTNPKINNHEKTPTYPHPQHFPFHHPSPI
jgi:hypothetical protein